MKVLVDTCVWSMALRRGEASGGREVSELIELIKELRVQLIGPVRQEIWRRDLSNRWGGGRFWS